MTPGTENVEKMEKTNARNPNSNAEKEAIHSGHFMVSDIDDTEAQDDIDSVSVPVLEAEDTTEVDPQQGFDFENACKETSNTYTFGPCSCKSISIDATLTKLFQCMTIAYSGKLTSPRWKNFKGLKLRWKDKIRLNNVIWRAWHMQFVMRQSPLVCQFASPLDGDTHNKPEFVHPQAVVLEGKYWKRRLETVCAEYKKWRLFYKDKQYRTNRAMSDAGLDFDCFGWQPRSHQSFHSPSSMIVDDDPFIDFNDTLFSCLIPNQPFAFPNPREIARGAGLADFMQPGLIQLQPNLEDFMDTWDNMFNTKLPVVNEEQPEEASLQTLLEQTAQSQQSNQLQNCFASSLSNQTSSSTQQYSSPGKNFDVDAASALSGLYSIGDNEFPSMDMTSMQAMASDEYKTQIDISNNYKRQTSNLQPMTSSDYKRQAAVRMETMTSNNYKSQADNLQTMVSNNFKPQADSVQAMPSDDYKCQGRGMQAMRSDDYKAPRSTMRSTTSNDYARRVSAPMPPPPPHPQNSHLGPSPPLQDVLGQPGLESINQGQLNATPVSLPQQNFGSASQQIFGSASQQNFSSGQQSPRHSPPQTFVSLNTSSPPSPEQLFLDSKSLSQRTSHLPSKLPTQKYVNIRRAPSPVPPTSSSPSISALSSPGSVQIIQSQPASTLLVHAGTPRHRESKSLTSLLSSTATTASHQQSRTDGQKHDVFIMPKGTPRMRSRSMSGPQATTAGLGVSAATSSILAHTPGVPSSALLAQLLTTGTYLRPDKVPDQPLPATSPGVTLISTVTNSQPSQTVVISPITLTTDTTGQILATTSLPSLAVSTLDNTPFSTTVTSSNSPPTLMGCPPPSVSDNRTSPPKPFRPKSDTERVQYREHRRVCHINAEQKRRCNIKGGFDMLHTLVPSLAQSPNSKISKAAMLHKAGEYIIQLRAERAQLQDEAELLRKQIESLNQAINVCQSQLPATGVPVSRQRASKLKDMFEEYVRKRTMQNWKFWIFSSLIQPLLNSYNNCVSTASMEDLCRTVLTWLEQHCSLVALRPAVLNSLRHLSTSTEILSDPSRIADEATQAVTKSAPRSQ